MKLSNIEMEKRLEQLKSVLNHTDKVGYVAARNTRLLKNALIEYFKMKHYLVAKYGEEEIIDDKPTGRIIITPTSEHFEEFTKEYTKIAEIEDDVSLMTLKYDEVIGILSGEEILNLDWMFEDEEE